MREDLDLTQEKLAYEAGLSKGYLSDIEAGRRVPSLAVLSRIAERLGVEPFDMLTIPSRSTREALIERTRGLSDRDLAELIAHLDAG